MSVRRTSAKMADGRELFYFDDVTAEREVLPDTRDLPHVSHGSTMRYDVLTGEWVSIAAHRQDRTYLPPAELCPLCPSTPERLTEIPAAAYDVVVFENRGEEIGVTLGHPHGQVYAYPFVAPRTARMLQVARHHRDRTGDCLFCSVVDAEESAGVRVVGRSTGWVAFVPVAARWPFEVHLYPTRHLPDLPAIDESERDALVPLLRDVLARFDALFDAPMPYMATWHLSLIHI